MIPEKVRAILDAHGLSAREFAPGSTATSVLAAQQLGVTVGQIAKSLLFIGKDGMLRADYGARTLYPQEKFKGFKAPAATIPNSIGHHKEFFEACKTGGPTTCNFDYSGALTEAVLLGTVAYRVGKKLAWDPVSLKATNCPEADRYLRPHYRKGWIL